MPINDDNLDNFSRVFFNSTIQIEGLDRFVKSLEKHFFSQVTVRNCSCSPDSVNLVVELDCNFGLREALYHFENGTWGNFESKENSFLGELNQLKGCNTVPIEVEEFSLFLKDTSIIINRIYDQSISQQLENILLEVNAHRVHFTKVLTETPYEIYISVFEDNVTQNEQTDLKNIGLGNNSMKDYFCFWGLYYYSEDDAVVYDLKKKSIIRGNLQMLNR